MEDLEIAAKEVHDRMEDIFTGIDKAEERLGALRQEVGQAGDQLDGDWEALTQQFDSFFQAVEAEKARLENEGQEARQTLTALEGEVDGAEQSATEAIDGGRDGIQAFGAGVESVGPEVTQMAEEARTAYEGLTQRTAAVEQQLATVLGEARDFLQGEALSDLQQMQADVRQRGEEMRAAVGECEGELDTAYGEWNNGLVELRATVDSAFEEVGQHTGQMVEEALSEVAQAQGDALEELSGYAATLAEVLSRLGEAAGERGIEIGASVGATEQDAADTAGALETMQSRLTEVRELLARFTFVSL